MIERLWRVVFDTNVFISASLSRNPTSPTRELLERWEKNEFTLLMCEALNDELIGKLIERHVAPADIARLAASLLRLAEWIEVPDAAILPVLPDPDDDVVLACAVLGHADFLVTYDPHYDVLDGEFRNVKIVKALPFLWAVRRDLPPDSLT